MRINRALVQVPNWSGDFAPASSARSCGALGAAKPADASWLWTLAYRHHEDRTPTHGYEAKVAMAAFAKSWRRE